MDQLELRDVLQRKDIMRLVLVLLGDAVGVYVIRSMLNDWLELGELFRYLIIRLPLGVFIIILTIISYRRLRYVARNRTDIPILVQYILLGISFLIGLMLMLSPNVYFLYFVD